MKVKSKTDLNRDGWESFHEGKASTDHILRWPDEQVVRVANSWRREGPARMTALDLQCGAGRHGVFLAGLGFAVVEVDLAATALRQSLQAFSRRRELRALGALRASSPSLPFLDDSFDVLVAWRSLHVFPREVMEQVLAEIARVVRSGGSILLSTRSDRNRYDEERVGKRGVPRPTELSFGELEVLCAPLEIDSIELSETTARNRALRDSYWVVHGRAR